MKITVLGDFVDIIDGKTRHVAGEEMDVDIARGKNLIMRGLAKSDEEEVAESPATDEGVTRRRRKSNDD